MAARGAAAVPVLWWVAAAVAVVGGHLVAAGRIGWAVATVGEAGIAAAAADARTGRSVADPLPFADELAARQLAMLQTVVPVGDLAAVDAARLACLVAGVLTALLCWPLLRVLGAPPPAAAAGVVIAGVASTAVVLDAGAAAATPAALWLTLAALLAARLRRPEPALVVAGAAVVTAPLVAAALLALLAHLVLDRTIRTPSSWARVPVGVGSAVLAVATAVLATRPDVGVGGAAVPMALALAVVAGGVVVLAVTYRAVPWLRAVLTPMLLLLAVVGVPGPARITAVVLVLPGLAILAGVLVGRLTESPARARQRGPVAGIAIALVLGLSGTVLLDRPPSTPTAGLAAWATRSLAPGTPVRADALDRVELLAAGFPADLLRGPGDPVGAGEVRLLARRPAGGLPGAEPAGCPDAVTVAAVSRGSGGAAAVVCRTDGGTAAGDRETRVRLGGALASNPALRLAPAAADALRAGEVDGRVIVVLAAMSSTRELDITDFPRPADDTPGVPRRSVLVSAVDGAPAAASPLLPTWLSGQQAPFTPALVEPDGDAVRISWFAATSSLPE